MTVYVAWNRSGPWAVGHTQSEAWDRAVEIIADYAAAMIDGGSPKDSDYWMADIGGPMAVDPVEMAA